MRIFLTGGTGFVGSNLLKYFLDNKDQVTALKRSKESQTKVLLNNQPDWVVSSFNEVEEKYFKDIDLLIHLAAHSAQPPYDNLQNCTIHNVIEPINLFEKAFNAGVRKFLVAGSCFEYGLSANSYESIPPEATLFPTDTYPASKAMASIAFIQWAIEKKVSLSIQRLFHVYGDGESKKRFYPALKDSALKGKDFSISKGEQIRDISEIGLSIKTLYKESERIINTNKYDVRVNNIGSGNKLSMKTFAQKLWSEFNAKGKLNIGSLPYRDREIMRYVPDLKKIHIIYEFD